MPTFHRKSLTNIAVSIAVLCGVVLYLPTSAKQPGDAASAAAAPQKSVLDLVERGLTGPAGIEDEGDYKLIDPIGPGAGSSVSAAEEVYASTLVVGKYTPWRAYRDPFAAAPGTTPPPGPYGPPRQQRRQGGSK